MPGQQLSSAVRMSPAHFSVAVAKKQKAVVASVEAAVAPPPVEAAVAAPVEAAPMEVEAAVSQGLTFILHVFTPPSNK